MHIWLRVKNGLNIGEISESSILRAVKQILGRFVIEFEL